MVYFDFFYIYFRTIPTRGKLKFTGFLCVHTVLKLVHS